MTKLERIAAITQKIAALSAAMDAEMDALPDGLSGEEYDAADNEIFSRYNPLIERLQVERIAAGMPAPKNSWFLGAMSDFIREADSNGGNQEFIISPRQVEYFSRYATGVIDDGRHGRYSSVTTGADVDGHLITVSSAGFITVARYTA